MPNHFHAIILINESSQYPNKPTLNRKSRSLGALVAGFKSSVTRRVNELSGIQGFPVWQRNYFDHIIRDEQDMNRIREYIVNNPAKWELDSEYTKNKKGLDS